ncbi:MAG: OmpH family outer membrane protein [Bacteroidetes bacterium]|nr:OmpH family outer membrane protein [Bacteroidota bacterium]
MKKITVVLFALILAIGSTSLKAQKSPKIGHIDFAELYGMMPGMDSAQKKYQDYAKSLKGQLDAMQNEYDGKVNDYQANQATLSDPIKKVKEKEILDLQERIQAFQSSAQESLQKKEQELTQPIIEKARQAVKDVAKENGYTYVLNTAEALGVVLYFDQGDDLMPLVKKKLGLK